MRIQPYRVIAHTLCLIAVAWFAAIGPGRVARADTGEKMIGLYIHQHWPYNHPYAARTWTLADWRGFVAGLREIGYNTILIWPMIETMPDPPTPSDAAQLRKLAAVVDAIHDLGMRVYLAICPNVGCRDEDARRATFQKRHFFGCDTRVNPADPTALAELMARREKLLRPLARVDGISVIDSDPGGYPGSTNADFIRLLGEYRKVLDRLRPGIELIYWMHAGWEAYSRWYQTGRWALGTAEEQTDCLRRLKELNPEPWGIANGLDYARSLGIADRVISFNYGLIEGEPSFPMTRYDLQPAYEGGGRPGPRGVMGNAQTHCVQLPNIFAFARGAAHKPIDRAAMLEFARDLLPDHGEAIVAGWEALASDDAPLMRTRAVELERIARTRLHPGRLAGLLLGSARRFLTDLAMELRMQAALSELARAAHDGGDVRSALARFVDDAGAWQRRHGYSNLWWDGRMFEALRTLHDPAIDECLDDWRGGDAPFEHQSGATPFERIANGYRKVESHTVRLLDAMRRYVAANRDRGAPQARAR